ncbi:hypothetical protein [Niastella sp. OAS944]|uniref:hypothetical protein n=1 Tax=Niastella sp. OAS944 TaxID=2664089 RepID=UPI003484AF36|nr:hypothetical protein [Chitinophagaceae bacterium OAS944]
MSYDEWKYKLNMEVSSDGWKFNRTMHFIDLKSALYALVDYDLDCYSSNAKHLNIPQIKNVSITDRYGINKLLVQIGSKTLEQDGINVFGQFYIFPEGVLAFEQEASASLASLKGYSSEHNYVLAAYTVQEPTDLLLPSTGLKLMREGIPSFKKENLPFQLSFNNKLFVSDGKIRSRQLVDIINQDVFHYKDIVAPFHAMLNITYARMEESLAWDKGFNGYFSGIHLSEIKSDGTGYKTFAAVNYQHTTYHHPKGKTDVNGAVLSIHSSYLDRIDLSPLKPVVPGFESRRLLAQMNANMTDMAPAAGVNTILKKIEKQANKNKRVNKVRASRKGISVSIGKGKSI